MAIFTAISTTVFGLTAGSFLPRSTAQLLKKGAKQHDRR